MSGPMLLAQLVGQAAIAELRTAPALSPRLCDRLCRAAPEMRWDNFSGIYGSVSDHARSAMTICQPRSRRREDEAVVADDAGGTSVPADGDVAAECQVARDAGCNIESEWGHVAGSLDVGDVHHDMAARPQDRRNVAEHQLEIVQKRS